MYMKQPWVATASDGGVQTPGPTVPHPRSYGTFPRKIGRYAIEEKLIPVEQAIRSLQRPAGGHPQADGPRLSEAGLLRRRGGLRPEDVPRHGDVRQAAPVRHRSEVGAGERASGSEGRRIPRRPRRSRPAAPGEVMAHAPPARRGPSATRSFLAAQAYPAYTPHSLPAVKTGEPANPGKPIACSCTDASIRHGWRFQHAHGGRSHGSVVQQAMGMGGPGRSDCGRGHRGRSRSRIWPAESRLGDQAQHLRQGGAAVPGHQKRPATRWFLFHGTQGREDRRDDHVPR